MKIHDFYQDPFILWGGSADIFKTVSFLPLAVNECKSNPIIANP